MCVQHLYVIYCLFSASSLLGVPVDDMGKALVTGTAYQKGNSSTVITIVIIPGFLKTGSTRVLSFLRLFSF